MSAEISFSDLDSSAPNLSPVALKIRMASGKLGFRAPVAIWLAYGPLTPTARILEITGLLAGMAHLLAYCKDWRKGGLCRNGQDAACGSLQTASMAKQKKPVDARPAHYLKQWREFRKLTQDQLGDAVGTTGSVIHLLENGARRLSDKWLRRLAPHLGTSAGYILDYDPNDLPTSILDIWADIPQDLRPHAIEILETFRRKVSQ